MALQTKESGMKSKKECIDQVMDWFDFNTVYRMMDAVDFGWSKGLDEFSEPVLREWVRDQIEKAYYYETKQVGTGGFHIVWEVDGEDHFLSVQFVGADWSTE